MSASPTTLVGNVTQDPELKFLANGTAKLEFSIAVNHYWTDADGEKQEKANFFNVVAWRNLAEDSASVIEKGMRVIVTGRLEQSSWEDKDSGEKKSRISVLADNIGLSVSGISEVTRKAKAEGDGKFTKKASPAKASAKPKQVAEDDEPF